VGKGIGAAGFNDILYRYGSRNLFLSALILYTFFGLYRLSSLVEKREKNRLRDDAIKRKDEEWLITAWENPMMFLSSKEQADFLKKYSHLENEDLNKKIRNEILPEKGIKLIDPYS
jgi:hypothetical protein